MYSNDKYILKFLNYAPSKIIIYKQFKDFIIPNSTLFTEREKIYEYLIKNLNLQERNYYFKSDTFRNFNEVKKINSFIKEIKKYLRLTNDFNKDNAQDYLDFYSFIVQYKLKNCINKKVKTFKDSSVKTKENLLISLQK